MNIRLLQRDEIRLIWQIDRREIVQNIYFVRKGWSGGADRVTNPVSKPPDFVGILTELVSKPPEFIGAPTELVSEPPEFVGAPTKLVSEHTELLSKLAN